MIACHHLSYGGSAWDLYGNITNYTGIRSKNEATAEGIRLGESGNADLSKSSRHYEEYAVYCMVRHRLAQGASSSS